MESSHRILRAIGFGAATVVGLHFAGFQPVAVMSIAFVIGVLFLLNVMTYWASTVAALALIWGGLVAAGIAPGAVPLEKQTLAMLGSLKFNSSGSPLAQAAPAATNETLAQKLADLKEACDKGLLSKDECEASRAKIVGEFEK
jgi:hypothetical protein